MCPLPASQHSTSAVHVTVVRLSFQVDDGENVFSLWLIVQDVILNSSGMVGKIIVRAG